MLFSIVDDCNLVVDCHPVSFESPMGRYYYKDEQGNRGFHHLVVPACGILLVVLRPAEGTPLDLSGRNVFAVGERGRILWQIESGDWAREGRKPNIYTGISFDPVTHTITAYNGVRWDVDPATGAVSNPRQVWPG